MIWNYCMFVNGYKWQNNINKIYHLGLFKLKQVSTKTSMQLLSWFLFIFVSSCWFFNTPNSLPLGAPDSSCVGSGALFCNFTSHWVADDYERIRILVDTHQTMDKLLRTYGGFLKWWVSPTTMGFPTTNWSFWGVKWGYHHLKKHPNISGASSNGSLGTAIFWITNFFWNYNWLGIRYDLIWSTWL